MLGKTKKQKRSKTLILQTNIRQQMVKTRYIVN